jgi:hypothetical protein
MLAALPNSSCPLCASVPIRDLQHETRFVRMEREAIQAVLPFHKARLLSYMKFAGRPAGLLFSFHEMKLVDGIARRVVPGASQS